MKKLMVLIIVVSLTAATKAGVSLCPIPNSTVESVLLIETSAAMISIQAYDSVVFTVYVEPAGGGEQWVKNPAVTHTAFTQSLPDPMTIALLGLAGLLLRRCKVTG
jgi:hypothetical protein